MAAAQLHTQILGTGGYLPREVRTNADLERMVETTDQWIVERTGIRERRIAAADETAVFMGTQAAQAALTAAGMQAADVDGVICATTSADYAFPSVACSIARELGISRVAAFDVAAACAGFNYAYALAHALIVSGGASRVLVVGVDLLSHACRHDDRTTLILFGDGAGAVVLGASPEPGTMATLMSSEPRCGDALTLRIPSRHHHDEAYLYMKGNEVFRHAVVILAELVTQTLARAGLSAGELDFLVPHQANLRIIRATARRLQLDMSRVIITLDRQGNTSAASVPLALDEGIRSGRIRRGHTVLLESFGGGLTWGSALIRY